MSVFASEPAIPEFPNWRIIPKMDIDPTERALGHGFPMPSAVSTQIHLPSKRGADKRLSEILTHRRCRPDPLVT